MLIKSIIHCFYFEGRCKSYIYGGCGKTENLFWSEKECAKTCDKDFNSDTPEVVVDNHGNMYYLVVKFLREGYKIRRGLG